MLFLENRKYLVEVRKKRHLETKKGIHGKVCGILLSSNDSTEQYVGGLLLTLIEIRGFADYDWKEKNSTYFRTVLPKVKKDVKDGLESLEYLKDKYN